MQKALASASAFLQRNKSLARFVKFALQVKYACGVWNACGREGIYFISLSAQAENFTSASALISHFASAKYFTKTVSERTNLSVKNANPSFSYPIDKWIAWFVYRINQAIFFRARMAQNTEKSEKTGFGMAITARLRPVFAFSSQKSRAPFTSK